jgi:hypothetical protein
MLTPDLGSIDMKSTTQVGRASRWKFEAGFALVTLLAIAFILSIVGRHSGWPSNDEGTTQAFETQIYAAHFRQFDFFPIWSSSDSYGLGSPLPLYYHKAFFMVSGVFYLLLGDIKSSLVLGIAMFMIVGVYGMRMALSTITKRRLLIVVGSLGFVFTNYSFADWLVRGDFTEFSAMMLIPWLLWWCLKLITTRSASFALVPIMVLLVLAHNVIALASIITLLVAIATYAAIGGLSSLKMIAKRLLISVLAVSLILSPLLLAVVRFDRYYDPSANAIQGPFALFVNFARPVTYFWNSNFGFFTDRPTRQLGDASSLVTQLDFAIWIPIAVALPFLLAAVVRRRHTLGARLSLPALIFLLGSLAAYMSLQFSVSAPIYRVVAPLQLLQFPWRLMAFITPLGIMVVVILAEGIYSSASRIAATVVSILSLAWLVSFIALSPLLSFQNDGFIPSSDLVAPRYQTFGQPPLLYISGFLPQVDKTQFSAFRNLVTYQDLLTTHRLAEPQSRNGRNSELPITQCSVVEPKNTDFESLKIRLTVTCNRPTRLALPISYNAYTTISITASNGRSHRISYLHLAKDPRIVIRVRSTKPEVLSITLPTLWKVLF